MSNAVMIEQINAAIGAHGAWKLRLRTAISTGQCDVTPATARCENKCQFGRWLHGPEIDSGTRAGVPYQVVTRLHADFHRTAGDILECALRGDRQRAQLQLDGNYGAQSEKLVRALTKWKRELA